MSNRLPLAQQECLHLPIQTQNRMSESGGTGGTGGILADSGADLAVADPETGGSAVEPPWCRAAGPP